MIKVKKKSLTGKSRGNYMVVAVYPANRLQRQALSVAAIALIKPGWLTDSAGRGWSIVLIIWQKTQIRETSGSPPGALGKVSESINNSGHNLVYRMVNSWNESGGCWSSPCSAYFIFWGMKDYRSRISRLLSLSFILPYRWRFLSSGFLREVKTR